MKLISLINNWLQKPYFLINSKRARAIIAFAIAFVIFFNLNVIRPHGVSNLQNNIVSFAFGYALLTFSVLIFYFFGARKIFPDFFNEERWTIGREIILILAVLITMVFVGWAYTNSVQIGVKNLSKISLPAFLKYTFTAFLPIITYTVLAEFLLNKFRKQTTKSIKLQLKERLTKKESFNKTIKIVSSNQQEIIQCNLQDLVYIKSEGNYVSIFIKNDQGELIEKTMRNKLLSLEELFKKYDRVFRCHKSYIINTKHVNDISGNARGYYFHLDDFEIEIPVSRKFNKKELLTLIS